MAPTHPDPKPPKAVVRHTLQVAPALRDEASRANAHLPAVNTTDPGLAVRLDLQDHTAALVPGQDQDRDSLCP